MKFGLVKGPGLPAWEAQLHEKLAKYDMNPVGICSMDNFFDTSNIKMPIRRLLRVEQLIKIPLLSKLIQWKWPIRDYMFGFNKAVKDLDLLHTTETFNTFSKQCVDSGKPTVVTVCGNFAYNFRRAYDKIDTQVKAKAKQFIVLTEYGKEMLKLEGVPENKITVIPHAIDSQQFKPASKNSELMKKYRITKNDKVIFYAGELVEHKGIRALIFAFYKLLSESKNKNLILLIAGKGPMKKDIDYWSNRLGFKDKIRFSGYIPYNQMQNLYNLCDVFCLPSTLLNQGKFNTAIQEQFGYVLIEAMSCEKPVVSSIVGSIPWVVDDNKNGLLVPPGNWLEISKALGKVLEDKKLAEKLGKNGREKVLKEYDSNVVAKQIAEVYRKALKD
jgi:glycosyltransferase involved in cell wall biosynthesis